MSNTYELASTAAKEILIKMLESQNQSYLCLKNDDYPKGIDFADHIGNCYQALYKKIFAAIQA
jgi:hypothetical protein